MPALLARQPAGAARHRREDVVRVHRPDDEGRPDPLRPAAAAPDRRPAAIHAAHADGVQVDCTMVEHHLHTADDTTHTIQCLWCTQVSALKLVFGKLTYFYLPFSLTEISPETNV